MEFTAQTAQDLRARSKEHGGIEVVLQLNEKEQIRPASEWTVRHLIAYRLLTTDTDTAFLPILKQTHNEECPLCIEESQCSQKLDSSTSDLIEEPGKNIYQISECELMRLPFGSFWAALAQAAALEPTGQIRQHPQRDRRPVLHEGYRNSAMEIDGSSPVMLSSSEFEADMNDVGEDEHEGRRTKPEEVTVHLVTQFLQYTLSVCLLQPSAEGQGGLEVRARVGHRTSKAIIAGSVLVTAEDDGGICQMRRQHLGWEMHHPCIALIEAKRAFAHGSCDKAGNYIP